MILLDTSGVLAWVDAGQLHHADAVAAMAEVEPPFLLSPFVLAELDYLLATRVGAHAQLAVLEEVARGAFALETFSAADVAAARDVIHKYSDQEIGLADASLVESLPSDDRCFDVLTLDERHFRTLRGARGGCFESCRRTASGSDSARCGPALPCEVASSRCGRGRGGDGEHLLDLGDHLAPVVADSTTKTGSRRSPASVATRIELDLGARDLEAGVQRAAAGTAEADGRRLVPHRVAAAELGGEDEHVEGVAHGVDGAAEVGAVVVAVPEAQREPRLVSRRIARQAAHADAGAEERRVEAQHPQQELTREREPLGRERFDVDHVRVRVYARSG